MATITQNGSPASGKAVSISVPGAGGVNNYSGITDGSGQFKFTYIPPRANPLSPTAKGQAQISATCSDCSNTAQQNITIDPIEMCDGRQGNPIQPASAAKEQSESDFTDSGAHSLSFTRHYKSTGITAPAGLGSHWSHSYAGVASLSADTLAISIDLGSGSTINFRRNSASDAWINTTASSTEQLTSTTSDVILRRTDDSQWRFAFTGNPNAQTGRLSSITQRNGWTANLTYNAAGQLSQITNQFGRSLSFIYNPAGQLIQIAQPDGGQINYQYDSALRNIRVGYPDNSFKVYHYERADLPNALTGITDEAGNRFASFDYDIAGRATSTQYAGNANRYQITYPASDAASAIPASGLLSTTATDPALYQASVQVTDPLGNPRSIMFQGGDGNVRVLGNSTPADSNFANRAFIPGSTLPSLETDFLGFTTQYQWDTARRLKTHETQAAGRPEQQTVQTVWHPTLRLPAQTIEQGKTTAYVYDAAGNVLTQTETDTTSNASNGQTRTWSYAYNPNSQMTTMTDPRGKVWTYAYDAQGNRTSITNPLGHISTNTHDGAGRVLTETAPNGLVTSFQYDPRGRVTRITRGSNLAAALQQITIYTYKPSGQIASATLPNGHAITYSYDAAQRLIGAADNRGNQITYTLDGMGNRISETIKDASNQIALASSKVINSLNRVEAIKGGTNPAAQTTALQYDANGNPVRSTDPLGNASQTTLDALRRPIATVLPDGAQADSYYNQLNQLTAATDPKAVQTSFIRNAWGEVLNETSPDIGTVIYTRDAAGNPLTMQDAKGQLTSYQYDALSRVTNITFADSKQHNFFYDGTATGQQKGTLREMQDASGSTKYERDTFGRITKKTQTVLDNPSAPTVLITQYTYDKAELASIRYPSGLTVAYPRNASGQISGITTKIGTAAVQPFVQNLTYTALGQPKSWSWAHCTTATIAIAPCTAAARSFDADGRMTASNIAAYQYDAASRITAITQNLYAQRSVPAASGTGTVTQLYTQPISWAVGYDTRGRITSFARIPASGNIPAGQQSASSESFTYDPNSNRLASITLNARDTDKDGLFEFAEQRQNTLRTSNIPATSNKLLGFTQTLSTITGTNTNSIVTTPIAYSLDANGNLVSDGLRDFRYDASDRLSKVILGTTFVGTDTIAGNELAAHTYLHNAAGQRVFKSEPKTETTVPNATTLGSGFVDWLRINFSWLWQTAQTNATLGDSYNYADGALPSWALLGEYGNGGASSTGRTEYIWLPTQDGSAIPVGMYRGGKLLAIHSDHLGTPRLMVDNTNQPVWQWAYSAFGDNAPTGILKPTTAATSAYTSTPGQGTASAVLLATSAPTQINNLRFPGQYADSETGHFYNYFRTYQPTQGRYTQADPIGLAGGLNRMGYANGDGINNFDPYGLDCQTAGGFTTCNFPAGGPSFRVPAQQGWPSSLNSSNLFYHAYNVVQPLGQAGQDCVSDKLRNNPTPGNPNPATAGGTANNARVPGIADANIVTSYLTNDLRTGAQVVVNMSGPASAFGPGYVARTVTNGVVHTYGEGTHPIQSSFVPSLVRTVANELVWGRQMQNFVNDCTCRR